MKNTMQEIVTIKEYNNNKDVIMQEVGEGIIGPYAIAKIIQVPWVSDPPDKEFDDKRVDPILAEKIEKINLTNAEHLMVKGSMTISEIKEFGVSPLVCVMNFRDKMIYVFVMDNGKVLMAQSGAIRISLGGITRNLLTIFEEFKIKELEDREIWIPIKNRWEILDLED